MWPVAAQRRSWRWAVSARPYSAGRSFQGPEEQATQKMAFILVSALGGLMLLYLFVSIVAIFDWSWLYSEQFRTMGIVVTTLSIGLAALSLVLDFATIDAGVKAGAPKYMEWYCGFGLVVTLIWLYVTILRLLALLARNR